MNGEDLTKIADELTRANDGGRVIVEDEHGVRYTLKRAHVIGARTDDPGLILKIAVYDEPGLF